MYGLLVRRLEVREMTHRLCIPEDCVEIVWTFMPTVYIEGCDVCGTCVVSKDRRGRIHFARDIVACGEAVCCGDCFSEWYVCE